MPSLSALDQFHRLCSAIRAKSSELLSPLELEMLELDEFRGYVGGGGSISYFIENADAKPSRLASLLGKVGPPQLAAIARDSSKVFPDDMPKEFSKRQAFIEQRFEHLAELALSLEVIDETGFEEIDAYFCCPAEEAVFAAVISLYSQPAA